MFKYVVRVEMQDGTVFTSKLEDDVDLKDYAKLKPNMTVMIPLGDKKLRKIKQVKVREYNEPTKNYTDIEIATGRTQARELLR